MKGAIGVLSCRVNDTVSVIFKPTLWSLRLAPHLRRSSMPVLKFHTNVRIRCKVFIVEKKELQVGVKESTKYKPRCLPTFRSQEFHYCCDIELDVSLPHSSIISQCQRSRSSISNRSVITCIKYTAAKQPVLGVTILLVAQQSGLAREFLAFTSYMRRISNRRNKVAQHIR